MSIMRAMAGNRVMKDKFKEEIISELISQGYSKEESIKMYENSAVSELIKTDEDYVLHYVIEDWVTEIIKNK